jgi:hypothetical protein
MCPSFIFYLLQQKQKLIATRHVKQDKSKTKLFIWTHGHVMLETTRTHPTHSRKSNA